MSCSKLLCLPPHFTLPTQHWGKAWEIRWQWEILPSRQFFHHPLIPSHGWVTHTFPLNNRFRAGRRHHAYFQQNCRPSLELNLNHRLQFWVITIECTYCLVNIRGYMLDSWAMVVHQYIWRKTLQTSTFVCNLWNSKSLVFSRNLETLIPGHCFVHFIFDRRTKFGFGG